MVIVWIVLLAVIAVQCATSIALAVKWQKERSAADYWHNELVKLEDYHWEEKNDGKPE